MPISEPGLDETQDPAALVVADPAAIEMTVGHLRALGAALERGGQGLKGIDIDGWQGQAADAFRARFDGSPRRWFDGADAFSAAAAACEDFRHTVDWARRRAAEAAAVHRQGAEASAAAVRDRNVAVDAHNAQVDDANAGRAAPPAPLPPFTDPGVAMLERAELMLSDVRASRDAAGADAASAVDRAAAAAPDPPPLLNRAGAELSDQMHDVGRMLSGVGEGTEDIVRTVRSLNPLDPWNVTHPAALVDAVSSTAAGLVTANLHPAELVKGVTGTGWGSDPGHALGKLIPGAALALATGGAGKLAAGTAERAAVAGRSTVAREAPAAGSFVRAPAKTLDSPELPARAELQPGYAGEQYGTSRNFGDSVVEYLDDVEREDARLTVHDGRLFDKDGRPFDTASGSSVWSADPSAIFVMDGKGNLYASNDHAVREFHHSSLMAGQPVAGAGEIRVADGKLLSVTDSSGHYRPPPECLEQVTGYLKKEGVGFDDVRIGRFGG